MQLTTIQANVLQALQLALIQASQPKVLTALLKELAGRKATDFNTAQATVLTSKISILAMMSPQKLPQEIYQTTLQLHNQILNPEARAITFKLLLDTFREDRDETLAIGMGDEFKRFSGDYSYAIHTQTYLAGKLPEHATALLPYLVSLTSNNISQASTTPYCSLQLPPSTETEPSRTALLWNCNPPAELKIPEEVLQPLAPYRMRQNQHILNATEIMRTLLLIQERFRSCKQTENPTDLTDPVSRTDTEILTTLILPLALELKLYKRPSIQVEASTPGCSQWLKTARLFSSIPSTNDDDATHTNSGGGAAAAPSGV